MIRVLLLLSLLFSGCFNQDSKIYIATYRERQVINLNTATLEELDELHTIGTVKASRIVDERKNNPFKSISDFKRRHVVGDTTFEKIKENIYVD